MTHLLFAGDRRTEVSAVTKGDSVDIRFKVMTCIYLENRSVTIYLDQSTPHLILYCITQHIYSKMQLVYVSAYCISAHEF